MTRKTRRSAKSAPAATPAADAADPVGTNNPAESGRDAGAVGSDAAGAVQSPPNDSRTAEPTAGGSSDSAPITPPASETDLPGVKDDAGKVSVRALTADLARRCGVKPSEVISHRVYADHIAVVCMDANRCWKKRLELGT